MFQKFSAKIAGLALLASLFATQAGLCQETVSKASKPAGSHGRLKIGLALGGGGTRRGAHVGVLKVFEEEGIPIDMICGTSIGAIVGGMYAAGVPIEDITDNMLSGGGVKSFITVPVAGRIFVSPIMVNPRLWGHPFYGL